MHQPLGPSTSKARATSEVGAPRVGGRPGIFGRTRWASRGGEHWDAIIGLRSRIVHDYMNLDMRRVLQVVESGGYAFVVDFLLGIPRRNGETHRSRLPRHGSRHAKGGAQTLNDSRGRNRSVPFSAELGGVPESIALPIDDRERAGLPTVGRWASKELKRIERDIVPRIFAAVDALASDPRPSGCRKLTGASMTYRVRVGRSASRAGIASAGPRRDR